MTVKVWRKWFILAGLVAILLPAGQATLLADSSDSSPETIAADLIQSSEVNLDETDSVAARADVEAAKAEVESSILPAWRSLEPTYSSATPLPSSGKAMYYNPGVMATVIESRLKYKQIEPCDNCIGTVAMLRYGDLDRKVWLQLGQSRIEGPFHVVDAAATQHVGMLLARGWVVDVDHETALRWNMRMPYVTIWDKPPLDLLLTNYTLPLHWQATLSPADVFVETPHSDNVLPDDSHIVVKHDIKLRSRTMQSFVDLAADRPPELYVK